MAAFVSMDVCITARTEKAVKCMFHEDTADEKETWVPLSVLEDPYAIDDTPDSDGNVTLSIKKWFLKKEEIDYDGDEDDGEVEDTASRFNKAPGSTRR